MCHWHNVLGELSAEGYSIGGTHYWGSAGFYYWDGIHSIQRTVPSLVLV